MITHNLDQPSKWIERFASLIPASSRQLPILDLACGSGRHTRYLLGMGHSVLAVDRNSEALSLIDLGINEDSKNRLETQVLDLEGEVWPLGQSCFSAVIVTNYLYRPRLSELLAAVAPGGIVIYETFAQGNEAFGKPSNPDFLLKPHELLSWVQANKEFQIIAFEQGIVTENKPASIQRICAVRSSGIPLQLPHERKNKPY